MKPALFSLILVTSWISTIVPAHALPLMSQNAAQNVSSALTLYPDHENANLFYFMPNSSTFAREQSSGLPQFGLTYWGLGADQPLSDAGAYMVFSMRLHSDPDQKAALDAFIQAGHNVAVLPVQASTIGLNTTKEGGLPLGRLFEEFNFSRRAGRAEDEVAVNSILTGLGAKVFRAAVDNPALIKFDYCYQVQGLGPDFDASIDVDWSRVYENFQTHASGGWWFFRAQVHTETEKLIQNNSVKIHVNGGTATDEEYIRGVADKIVERLFKPELQMQPSAARNDGIWSFSRLKLQYTRREELKHEHFEYKRRQLVERDYCTPLVLSDIAQFKDRLVRNADAPR